MDNLNWYPGHMAKTRRLIEENLKFIDAVVEIIDARIPFSGRNPCFDDMIKSKPDEYFWMHKKFKQFYPEIYK